MIMMRQDMQTGSKNYGLAVTLSYFDKKERGRIADGNTGRKPQDHN
jgi:hypothetical protein